MSKLIVLTGTPGAGKTTVLSNALEQLKDDSTVNVLNYAEVMLAEGKEQGLGDDHDAIRKQNLEVQRDLQKKAGEKIAALAKDSTVTVVDTHATIKTPNGYLPGLPRWVVEALQPQTIVIIEADASEILGRRNSDKSRVRDAEDETGIERHQELNRSAALASATLVGATVRIIQNHNDKLDEAGVELAALLGGN